MKFYYIFRFLIDEKRVVQVYVVGFPIENKIKKILYFGCKIKFRKKMKSEKNVEIQLFFHYGPKLFSTFISHKVGLRLICAFLLIIIGD